MSRKKWPQYAPEKRNELVLLIADKCYADKTDTPIVLKNQDDAEAFMTEQIKFLALNGFELDAFGSTDAMLARFDKKAFNHAITEVFDLIQQNPQWSLEKLIEQILRLKK